jgi:hypothetical protein
VPDAVAPADAAAVADGREADAGAQPEANDGGRPMKPTLEEEEIYVNKIIARRLRANSVGVAELVPFPTLLALDDVRTSSFMWSGWFFSRDANPHVVEPPPRVSISFKWELVRYEYAAAGTPIVMIEGETFSLVKVGYPGIERLLRLDQADQLREVTRIGANLLTVTDPWKPRKPSSPEEVIAFSTNPYIALMTMGSWDQRVEAGVYHNELFFLLHKKHGQWGGFWADNNWFNAKFRAKYAPKHP